MYLLLLGLGRIDEGGSRSSTDQNASSAKQGSSDYCA